MRVEISAALKSPGQHSRLQRFADLTSELARIRRVPWLPIFLIAWSLAASPANAETILVDTFETGRIDSDLWNPSTTDGCVHSVRNTNAASGTYYLRSSLTANPPDGGNYRCELNAKGVGAESELGISYYYGFAFRVPSDFAFDPAAGDSIMQLFHEMGAITGENSHHAIRIDDTRLKWDSHGDAGGPSADLVPLARGAWTRVCVRAIWATNNTGSIKVWVNPASEGSTPKFQFSGQTLPTDYTNVGKLKIGLYKTKWRSANFPDPFDPDTSPRIVEHDDVRMGSKFADACGGGTVAPEPPTSVRTE